MNGTLARLTDSDLSFLANVLAAGAERSRMLRALREDEEILRAMLADERLFRRIVADPQMILQVSPRLLFCVLMSRVKRDLEDLRYTVEPGQAVVFDGPRIAALLQDARITDYLVEVLVSFVRVRSTSFAVRVRRGLWARYRFSDLDLPGLIRHAAALGEAERFGWYRRIGDLCLFLLGVFPDSIRAGRTYPGSGKLSRAEYMTSGRRFYAAAAQHPRADVEVAEVLERLAEAFELAVKPLDHLASRYLLSLRDRLYESQ